MNGKLTALLWGALTIGTIQFAFPAIGHAEPQPIGWPYYLRWDLSPKWLSWSDGKVTISWPANDGCAGQATKRTLPVGTQIDRIGFPTGSFFHPSGSAYSGRAVPYTCTAMDYRVYSVEKPLDVKECKAAPWFGEPGGGTQFMAEQMAVALVENGTLKQVSEVLHGRGASPLCLGR